MSRCLAGSANRLSAVGRLEVGAPRKGSFLVQHFVEVFNREGLTEPAGQGFRFGGLDAVADVVRDIAEFMVHQPQQ